MSHAFTAAVTHVLTAAAIQAQGCHAFTAAVAHVRTTVMIQAQERHAFTAAVIHVLTAAMLQAQECQQAASASGEPGPVRQSSAAGASHSRAASDANPADVASPVSSVAATLRSGIRSVTDVLFSGAKTAEEQIKEAPQLLGNRINDALPGSSKKQASRRQQDSSKQKTALAAEAATVSKANSTKDGASDAATNSPGGKMATSKSTHNAEEQRIMNVITRITRGYMTGSRGECSLLPTHLVARIILRIIIVRTRECCI